MNFKYPLATSSWDQREYDALQRVIASNKFSMGDEVAQFEKNFAKYFGSKYAVMVNSGSSANLLMTAALFYTKNSKLNLKRGDEIIVPAVSWSTTYAPLYQYGLHLKFVDIDLETLNYDIAALELAISNNTRAIMAVNLLGNPNDFKAINEIIIDKDIVLVDCFPDNDQIDFETPIMSLPFLFNTNLDTIPAKIPYLFTNDNNILSWAKRLTKSTFKVGICWQGSKNKIDYGRSFSLSLFEGISKIPNVELISLHKGEGEKQIKEVNFDLTILDNNFDSGENAFVDTAAVMMNCDLIVTSDTAIAHLAGALGCPTWVVLKKVPDWRWMLERKDSPWYPNLTLYRQKQINNWTHVFDKIEMDLQSLIKEKGIQ